MKLNRILMIAGALFAAALTAAIALPPTPAFAQAAGTIQSQNPMTRDVGVGTTGKILNVTTLATGTSAVSADQSGFNVSRIICIFNQSTHASSPSTTISIHNKDAATGTYYTLLTSAAITADNAPTGIAAGAGLLSQTNLAVGMPLARTWRIILNVTGTGSTTGTVGCSVQ